MTHLYLPGTLPVSVSNTIARLHTAVCGCLLLLLISAPLTATGNQLPDLGNSADRLMTLQQEKQLGREFMRNVRRQLDIINDPIITRYVQTLGDELSSQLDRLDHQFQFFVVNDVSINAFAGPGGHIGVHSGLIMEVKSEDELASVLAHEIAHISQRHLLRRFEKQSNMALTTMAALVTAILLGQGDAEVGEAIFTSTIAGTTQSELNFSRTHEREADYVGIELLAKTGYNPSSMATFFETLLSKNRYGSANLPEFILTHPLTTSRISDAKNRAMHYKINKASNKDLDRLGLIQARLASLPEQYLTKPDHADRTGRPQFIPTRNLSKRYWGVLQLIAAGKLNQADKQMVTLIKEDRPRIIYSITRAEIATKAKNFSRANEILAYALLNNPGNQAITELYASTLIINNDAQKAYHLIRNYIDNGHEQANLYKMLADSAKKTGRLGEAYESLAEYHYHLGHNQLALEHLETALSIEKDHPHRTLRLHTRVEQIQQEILANQQKPDADIN